MPRSTPNPTRARPFPARSRSAPFPRSGRELVGRRDDRRDIKPEIPVADPGARLPTPCQAPPQRRWHGRPAGFGVVERHPGERPGGATREPPRAEGRRPGDAGAMDPAAPPGPEVSAAPAGVRPASRSPPWTTPQKLQACVGLCLAASAVLLVGAEAEVAVSSGWSRASAGRRSQRLGGRGDRRPTGEPRRGRSRRPIGQRRCSHGPAGRVRAAPGRGLRQPGGRRPEPRFGRGGPERVGTLIDELGAYLERIGEARTLRELGSRRRHPQVP